MAGCIPCWSLVWCLPLMRALDRLCDAMSLQAANTGFNAAPDASDSLSPIQKAVATVLKDGAAMSDGISLQEVQARFTCHCFGTVLPPHM